MSATRIVETIVRVSLWIASAICLLAPGAAALAQHSAIVFEADGDALHVLPNDDGLFVGADDFGRTGFPANQTDHPEFECEPGGLTIGAYGLWLQLTSPSYASSNEFIILLNYGLDVAAFEAGVEAADALIPEPTSALLLALCALFGLRRR